jgi:hypothetical protein
MIRIVVGQTGRYFVAYRDECRLGDIERFFDGAGGSVWRWQADGVRGEERTLGDVLDAIERAHDGRAANPGSVATQASPRRAAHR